MQLVSTFSSTVFHRSKQGLVMAFAHFLFHADVLSGGHSPLEHTDCWRTLKWTEWHWRIQRIQRANYENYNDNVHKQFLTALGRYTYQVFAYFERISSFCLDNVQRQFITFSREFSKRRGSKTEKELRYRGSWLFPGATKTILSLLTCRTLTKLRGRAKR